MEQKVQFLIGATASGSGKTTLTLGLLRALRKRGLVVQPFKCGPDYLDPKHHEAAAGRESCNLDTFMATPEEVKNVYARRGTGADACVTEGVMGLFDGFDGMRGSSAEVATRLGVPVVLVVPARSTAYTVAATLYGFKHFRPDVRIGGVIFNFVGSPSHYASLERACRDVGVEALGYLPKCAEMEIPSRHLGLNVDMEFCFEDFAERIARRVEETVNIGRLLEVTVCPFEPAEERGATKPGSNLRIAVARDEAFNFIYVENLCALEQEGKVTFFSPLHDKVLPPADFVYLPGGYPELHLKELACNTAMLASVREYCEGGGRMLAECGGMMYLCEAIRDPEGKAYPMCGFLPREASMEGMKLHLGYREVRVGGQAFRGHEFHYSHIAPGDAPIETIGETWNARGTKADTFIYKKNRTVASYVHFYRAGEGSLLEVANAINGSD